MTTPAGLPRTSGKGICCFSIITVNVLTPKCIETNRRTEMFNKCCLPSVSQGGGESYFPVDEYRLPFHESLTQNSGKGGVGSGVSCSPLFELLRPCLRRHYFSVHSHMSLSRFPQSWWTPSCCPLCMALIRSDFDSSISICNLRYNGIACNEMCVRSSRTCLDRAQVPPYG